MIIQIYLLVENYNNSTIEQPISHKTQKIPN